MKKTVRIVAMMCVVMMLGSITASAAQLENIDTFDGADEALTLTDGSFEATDSATNDNENIAEPDDLFIEDTDASAGEETDSAQKLSDDAKRVFKKMAGGKDSKNKYAYKQLTNKQKELYNALDKEVSRILCKGGKLTKDKYGNKSTKVFWKGKYDMYLFNKVWQVYKMNNPQAFFLKDMTSVYLDYKRLKVGVYCLVCKDTDTPTKIRTRAESIAKNLKACKKQVDKEKGDYNKARKVMGLLCKRLEHGNYYNKEAYGLNSTFYKDRYKGYNEDYALTFTALARYCGLEAYPVHGDEGDPSCNDWNRVKVDGKFYNVDANFCDWEGHGPIDEKFNEDFFLKSNATINKNKNYPHVADKDYKKFSPKASGTSYKPKKK